MPGPRGSNERAAVAGDVRNLHPAVGDDGRTGMTRPAWGASAADRLETWSERSMHSNRQILTGDEGIIDSAIRSALPAREFTPRGGSSSLVGDHRETQSILLVMPGLRDHAPGFLWSETLVKSRTSRPL